MLKTWKTRIAGFLDIVNGIFWTFVSLLLMTVYISCPPSPSSPISESLLHWLATISYMIIGLLAIIGGIYALRRHKWRWALIGSICAAVGIAGIPVVVHTLSWLPFTFVFAGFGILGVPAIILTLLSKNEF